MEDGPRRIREALAELGVRRVVLWGYRGPQHTHHWVMVAMKRALAAAAPDVELCWYDNAEPGDPGAYDDALVLGNLNVDHVDYCMPIRRRATYLVHDHAPGRQDASRYEPLRAAGRVVFYDVFRGRPGPEYREVDGQPLCFTHRDCDRAVITWATDMLPDEIDDAWFKAQMRGRAAARNVVFVGSVWRANAAEMVELAQACVDRDLRFEHFGRIMVPVRWPDSDAVVVRGESIPFEENVQKVADAFIAPALQGQHQLGNDDAGNYVPCRIFKNISYGAFGVSNNPTVADVLGDSVVVDADIGAMLDAAAERLDKGPIAAGLGDAMTKVRRTHTYFNRLALLLELAVARRDHVGHAPAEVAEDTRLTLGVRRALRRVVGWRWQ